MENIESSDDESSQHSSNGSESAVPTSSSVSLDSTDFKMTKRKRPRRKASQISFIDPDSPPVRQPVLKVIKRPGKRGRPPRRWVYSDSDDVLFDEPKDRLVKRLSRNENEKMRRDRLNTYVAELAHLLPTVVAANRKMEKSSILRLAVNYLRVYQDFVKNGTESEPVWNFLDEDIINQLIQQCDGDFLLASSKKGTIAFASEGLTDALGHKVVDVLGQTVLDIIHPDDLDLYLQQFNPSDSCKRQFCIRLLSNHPNDTQQFISISFQGFIKKVAVLSSSFNKGKEDDQVYLIAIGKLPNCHKSIEDFKSKVPCSSSTYIVHHNALGEIQHLDPRSALLTGFMPKELVGENAYKLVKEEDQPLVAHSHFKLMTADLVETVYRILNKVGSIQYLRTVTHKVLHPWTKNIKYLISVNDVVSEELGKRLLKDFIQKKKVDELEQDEKTKFFKDEPSPEMCLRDFTISSSSSRLDIVTDVSCEWSNPYNIPCIRAYLPRLWNRVHEDNADDDEARVQCVSTSTEEPETDCGPLFHAKPVAQNTSTTSSGDPHNASVKHVPHRLRSLILPASLGFVKKPGPPRFKTCTKAYRSNKLNSLLISKDKSTKRRVRKERIIDNSAESNPEPGSSSASDNNETQTSAGQLVCNHESSFCDNLANIKSPQLPLWTRLHDMRQESQSSLLYRMLKRMENEEHKSRGMHHSLIEEGSDTKSQDSVSP